MVAVILGREFAVTVLRSIAHARGIIIAASPLGKVKMAAEVTAILALILGHDHLQQFFRLGIVALWVALITAVVSGIDYYRKFNRLLAHEVMAGMPTVRLRSLPRRAHRLARYGGWINPRRNCTALGHL